MDQNSRSQKEAARAEYDLRVHKLISAHSKVAAMLRSRRARGAVIRYAYKQIGKWKGRKLCSQDYINEWSVLLQSPLKTADVLEEKSSRANRLRQNTPFAAYLI